MKVFEKVAKLEDLITLEHDGEKVVDNGTEECIAKHIENYLEGDCPPVFDGVMCWGPTPPNTSAIQKCFSELNGLLYDSSRKYLFFYN